MIMLLALPIIAAVALVHRYLVLYAPSNVLVRRVQAARPRLSTVATLLAFAGFLLAAVKAASDAVEAGAPGWLNLVVLVLAWDAIKVGALAVLQLVGWVPAAAWECSNSRTAVRRWVIRDHHDRADRSGCVTQRVT